MSVGQGRGGIQDDVITAKLIHLQRRCALDMAGFRNVLVHRYDQVDLSVVYGVLRQGLEDLEAFGRCVAAALSG